MCWGSGSGTHVAQTLQTPIPLGTPCKILDAVPYFGYGVKRLGIYRMHWYDLLKVGFVVYCIAAIFMGFLIASKQGGWGRKVGAVIFTIFTIAIGIYLFFAIAFSMPH